MQLSEKEKQALQEKYKAQRQAMWSGKQSKSQDSEEETTEVDQGDVAEEAMGSTNTTSSESQSDASSMAEDQPESTETADEETNQDGSNVQTESDAEATPIAEETGEQQEEEEPEREGERIFWEANMEGGPSTLTWKLVIAVIGVAVILVGVGVYLGFLFAG